MNYTPGTLTLGNNVYIHFGLWKFETESMMCSYSYIYNNVTFIEFLLMKGY